MTTRADMVDSLSLSAAAPTKTFVLEVHADDPEDYLANLGAGRVVATEDAFLQILQVEQGQFWVDRLDDRFWSFHTEMPVGAAYPILRYLVNTRRDLDWMWLPSKHLRDLWPGAVSRRVRTEFTGHRLLGAAVPARDLKVQLSGQDAEALLDLISRDPRYRPAVSFDSVQVTVNEREFGLINEGVNRMGRFAVSGDSLDLHLQFVRRVINRYRALVTAIEERAIGFQPFETGGGTMVGRPVVIRFDRQIVDLNHFLNELLSSREPFRLWGVAELVGDVAEVEAVDLHVGDRLRMDVGRDWLRVYVGHGACGNTVARLISNLQHRFDGALRLTDPDVDTLVGANHVLPPADTLMELPKLEQSS